MEVTFRPLADADLGLLADWLGRPHVQAWWRDPLAPAKVVEKYVPRIRGQSPIEVFVVLLDGFDVGMIQRYRIVEDPELLAGLAKLGFDGSQSAGLDYLLGDASVVGRGVGTEMVRSFSDRLFADLDGITTIAVTPEAANAASCRLLEKAGYRRDVVGLLPSGDDPADADPGAREFALYLLDRPTGSARRD